MDAGEIERREYFRITDRLFLEFREVDYQESIVLEESLKQPEVFSGLPERPVALSAGPAFREVELYDYLEAIERKLDRVIDLLSKREGRFQGVYKEVNISGSGLKFCSSTELHEGALLEIAIGLPLNPDRRIRALGKVVRSSPSKKEGEEGWETAVGFVAISEKDRDALVGYVFSKEREHLRLKQTS